MLELGRGDTAQLVPAQVQLFEGGKAGERPGGNVPDVALREVESDEMRDGREGEVGQMDESVEMKVEMSEM